MKRFSKVQMLFSVASILLCALGCSSVTLPRSTPVAPVRSKPDPLNGTSWQLIAFGNKENHPALPEQPVFLVEFRKGVLSLKGGCNSVFGYYVLENEQITITFAKQTLVECPDPVVNGIERAFFDAMGSFNSYTLEGDEVLRIRYGDGELLLHRVTE